MKIKVATTFGYRSISRGEERFVSSSVAVQSGDDDNNDNDSIQLPLSGNLKIDQNDNKENKTEKNRSGEVPRFMVIGGKHVDTSELVDKLCDQFGCERVNAIQLIETNIVNKTAEGLKLLEILQTGGTANEDLILELLSEKLHSDECKCSGYVFDGIPEHHSTETPMMDKVLQILPNAPTHIVNVEDDDGTMDNAGSDIATPTLPDSDNLIHPIFPDVDEVNKIRSVFVDDQRLETTEPQLNTSPLNIDEGEKYVATIKKGGENSALDSGSLSMGSVELDDSKLILELTNQLSEYHDLWNNSLCQLIIMGHPCTRKTNIVKSMSKAWNCCPLSAPYGVGSEESMNEGVFDMMKLAVGREACTKRGFIIDYPAISSMNQPMLDHHLHFLRSLPTSSFLIILTLSAEKVQQCLQRLSYVNESDIANPETAETRNPLANAATAANIDGAFAEQLLKSTDLTTHFRKVICLDGGKDILNLTKEALLGIMNSLSQSGEYSGSGTHVNITTESDASAQQNESKDDFSQRTPNNKPSNSTSKRDQDTSKDEDTPVGCECAKRRIAARSFIWPNGVPKLLVVGKPCSGKTRLAQTLNAEWGCQLVNASDLIRQHLNANDQYGEQIKRLMQDGQDLDDTLVINIVRDHLNSAACVRSGYILDDFPTYSEKSASIEAQLDFISTLQLDYIMHLTISDEALKIRWEKVQIDIQSGKLYPGLFQGSTARDYHVPPRCCTAGYSLQRDLVHDQGGAFQLITRHEETSESIAANFKFYNESIFPVIMTWVRKMHSNKFIDIDAELNTENILQILNRMLSDANPNQPEVGSTIINATALGNCCTRCFPQFAPLEPPPELWVNDPPRIIIFGKPCTGKTTIARRLCAQWKCQLVNASDLIEFHLKFDTSIGKVIRVQLIDGSDLSDRFVVCMIMDKLSSPECLQFGYILDAFPTHSEKCHSISEQILLLRSLPMPPNYIINIEVSDAVLRERWATVRIDLEDGILYTKNTYDGLDYSVKKYAGKLLRHPDFPDVDEGTKDRLLTRHEELQENLDKHFAFYNTNVVPCLRECISKYDPLAVHTVNGQYTPTKMLNTILCRLNMIARDPLLTLADLYLTDASAVNSDTSTESLDSKVQCDAKRNPQIHADILEELWLDKPPKLIIVGQPLAGKTTLGSSLCTLWNSVHITPTLAAKRELKSGSMLSNALEQLVVNGKPLPDNMLFEVVSNSVNSPEAISRGYILDGFPSDISNERAVEKEFTFIKSMQNGPEYVIHVLMTEGQTDQRKEVMLLSPSGSAISPMLTSPSPSRRPISICHEQITPGVVEHPDFPVSVDNLDVSVDHYQGDSIVKLEEQLRLYRMNAEYVVSNFVNSFKSAFVIKVSGSASPSEMNHIILQRFSILARHPNLPLSALFPEEVDSDMTPLVFDCSCSMPEIPLFPMPFGKPIISPIPRVLLLGNACTGKTSVAKKLCKEFNCVLINASELIHRNLYKHTDIGKEIRSAMANGEDLSDSTVWSILHTMLQSNKAAKYGYIIDDLPTSSEKSMPITEQLKMMKSLSHSVDFFVDIQISDYDLLKRWETMRVDIADGLMYSCGASLRSPLAAVKHKHPTFPGPRENMRQRLITRHEEIKENILKQSIFYNHSVRPAITQFLNTVDPKQILRIDGNRSISDIVKAIRDKLLHNSKIDHIAPIG